MGPKNSFSHIERHENKEKTSVLLWSQNSLTNPNSVVINWRKKNNNTPWFHRHIVAGRFKTYENSASGQTKSPETG
jgi:hypothetical protein